MIPAFSLAQERTGYRVEMIVLRLVEFAFPPQAALEPSNFSFALDLQDRQDRITEWTAYVAAMDLAQAAEVDLAPPLNPVVSRFPEIEGLTLVEQRSERMSGVWRNLRLSAEYRPEIYLSWEQDAEGDFPFLRVHNDEHIRVQDAWSGFRVSSQPPLPPGWELNIEPDTLVLAPEEPDESGETLEPVWIQHVFQYDFDTGTVAFDPVPEPVYDYSLDGQVRMRRSRFLHIDLDITYQVPAPGTLSGWSGPPLQTMYQGYETYHLKQTRQIRTGRMEYFDSPVLGVLVWVTAIEAREDEDIQ